MNTKLPRGLLSVRLSVSIQRKSPPQRNEWRLYGFIWVRLTVSVWSVRIVGVWSRRPLTFVNDSDGTPHENGSVETPTMPASPATSVWYA